jgi:hypothetical protein
MLLSAQNPKSGEKKGMRGGMGRDENHPSEQEFMN